MQPTVDTISGALKINNLPDLACKEINSFADALKALAQFSTIELPASITGVVFGASEPSESEVNKIWARTDNNGNFIGFYVFTAGEWRPAYTLPDGHIEWISGDSRSPPPGFQLINNVGPNFINSGVRTHLQAFYFFDATSTYYLYYAAAFVGY